MDTPNWDEIRAEYIAGGTSYRKLAAKYGISIRTLSDRARAEGWVALREQVRAKTVSETVETIAKNNARVDERIYELANQLLDKLETAVAELDRKHVRITNTVKKGSTKTVTAYDTLDREQEGPIDRGGMQSLTGVLRDLQIILHDRHDLDRQEQMARIERLRKDAEAKEDDDTVVEVIMDRGLEDYV